MAVNTILLDFSVDPSHVKSESRLSSLNSSIGRILGDHLSNLKQVHSYAPVDGGLLSLYQSDRGALTTVRFFSSGIVTVNIEYYKADDQEPLLNYELMKELEHRVNVTVDSFRSKLFPPLKRGSTLDVYLTSSDERLLEYDIDNVIFEEKTPYQKVQILHSKSLGNMLVLDDLQNIAESDLIYTESLMARGKEDYKGKEIVILGGGDGALLYELLKEQPKNVVMLEIDDVVMKACAKYMRSVCGDVLDGRSGSNYQIIVGDCMESLDQFINEGKKFDYVFGDLTDIPISTAPTGKIWDFILTILEKAFKILKSDGKFMTHGNGTASVESLKMYENQLMKLRPPVEVKKSTAFVPSFLEDWVFYQISFAKNG